MKQQPRKLHEVQSDYKDAIVGLCIVCEKPTSGWYGRWGNHGTCSKKCEVVQEAIPKYLKKGEGDGHVSLPSKQDP